MAPETEYYFTISHPEQSELKKKGSRFIAFLQPVQNETQAEEFIQNISKKHYDATHNCFAWRTGIDNDEQSRFNDDGEPSGTAGKPILQAILGADLTNIAIVVTRYFGGTKLGTGGLVRAYGGAASAVLEQAARKKVWLTKRVELQCNYSFLKTVLKRVEQINGRVTDSEYLQDVSLKIELRLLSVEPFVQYIVNQSAGNVNPKILE